MLVDMSIKVERSQLQQAITGRPYAYLLSSGRERPHVVQITPALADGVLYADSPGRSAVTLAQSHPHVTLLYPPDVPDGYSLIVDGTARVNGQNLHISVDHAVLHRRATAGSPPSVTGCGADCHPISTD